ncbi:MAG: glutaredoxin [Gammaproteobacteria bacterium]|nr:MAG: glutaredoxin [Gammaproteobacteria bacterium]
MITRPIILTAEKLFNTTPIERSEEEQAAIDEQTRSMAMYEFQACPYCVKTRRALKRLNLKIECRDALNNQEYKQELTTKGGKFQVPCLRINDKDQDIWMYESSDIIKYLDQRFGSAVS